MWPESVADIFNTYFSTIVDYIDKPDNVTNKDMILTLTEHQSDHPNVLEIKQHCSGRRSFVLVDENQIEKTTYLILLSLWNQPIITKYPRNL